MISLVPIFVAGFWVPYLSLFPRFDPSLTPPVHAHAILLFGWLALLIAQPIAIRSGAFKVHRTLGRLSYVLFPLVVVTAIAMMVKAYGEDVSAKVAVARALENQFLSAAQMLLLVAAYAGAILAIRRGNVAIHMRFMICIAFILLPAGLARTFGYWLNFPQSLSQTICLGVIDACLVGLVLFDRSRKATSWPFAAMLGAYLVIEAAWFGMGRPI